MTSESLYNTLGLASLESVYDPEIGLNVVELGLIYDLQVKDNSVFCLMTLTSQFCPMGESIIAQVEHRLKQTFTDKDIQVELTFNPPWGPERISESGRDFLNE